MEDLLKQILNKLDKIEGNQTSMQSDVTEIKEKLNLVYDQTAKTCEDVTSVNTKLDDLKDDLDYLTHKENQTEKEVYSLKKKIQIIK